MEIKSLSVAETKGINSDITPVNLPPDTFSSGINFRCINKSLTSFSGTSNLVTFVNSVNPAKVISIIGSDIVYYVVFGNTSVLISNGISFFDISSTVYDVLADGWDYCDESQVPIFNNPIWYPEYWMPVGSNQVLKPLPFSTTKTWQAANKQANLIRSHKNFLFALGTIEDGTEYNNRFRWSAPADSGGIPYTWDETDLSSIAGTAVLQGNYGRIIEGMTQRDTFVIYSETGTNILTYIGDPLIWKITEFSNTSGILAKNCVVCADNKHYVITQDDIIIHDGTNLSSLLHNRLRMRVKSALASEYSKNSYVLAEFSKKEVWFCIVESGFQRPNIAIIYNWVDDTLALLDIGARFASMVYAPIIFQKVSYVNVNRNYDTIDTTYIELMGNEVSANADWDSQTQAWANNDFRWNYTNSLPVLDGIIGIDPVAKTVSALTVNDFSKDFDTVLVHEDFVFDNLLSVSSVVSMYPIIHCYGEMSIQMGSKYNQGEPTMWQPAVIFNPSQTKKVDIRTTGVYHSWKFSSIGNVPFTLSGFTIYYANNGKR
jgi:hypothetical protein